MIHAYKNKLISKKIYEKDIEYIRKEYLKGERSQLEIAKEMGISQATISLIMNKKRLSYV